MEDGASCVSLAIICTLCSVAANNLVISNIVDTLCATKHRQKYMLILIDVRCLSFASIRCDLNLWREKKRRSDRDLEIFRRISFFFLHVTSMCSLSIFFSSFSLCQKCCFSFRIVWFVCSCVWCSFFFGRSDFFFCTVFFFTLTSRSWKSCTRLWCVLIFRYADAISYGFHIDATVSTANAE